MNWVLPVSFGVLLWLTLLQARRPIRGKLWSYLRCLFPSWRFFESVDGVVELEFCVSRSTEEPASWLPALPPPTRKGLLLNAEWNLWLAERALLEQLQSELEGVKLEAVTALASYRMVRRVVERRARASNLAATGTSYRFRLRTAGELDFESESHAL